MGLRNVTVWRSSFCLFVPSAHTQRDLPEAARYAASVHFRLSITRNDILV